MITFNNKTKKLNGTLKTVKAFYGSKIELEFESKERKSSSKLNGLLSYLANYIDIELKHSDKTLKINCVLHKIEAYRDQQVFELVVTDSGQLHNIFDFYNNDSEITFYLSTARPYDD